MKGERYKSTCGNNVKSHVHIFFSVMTLFVIKVSQKVTSSPLEWSSHKLILEFWVGIIVL